MTNRETMSLALDALEDSMYPQKRQFDAIVALKQALAQPEQDWSLLEATQESLREHMARVKELEARRQWVGLTDDEINKIVDLNTSDDGGFDIWCDGIAVARIVCAKIKEKNT
jgi:hypothetical protein